MPKIIEVKINSVNGKNTNLYIKFPMKQKTK